MPKLQISRIHRLLLRHLRGNDVGAVLARGAGSALTIRVASSAVGLAVQIVLARVLGAKSYGMYVYALTWMTFLTLAALMGFHSATVRFVSQYRSLQEWGTLRGYLRRSQEFTLLSACLASLLVIGCAHALRARLGAELVQAFQIASLLIPPLVLLQVQSAALRGLKLVTQALVPLEIVRPLLIAVGAGLLYLFASHQLGAPAALTINIGATTAALALTFVILRRSLPPDVYRVPPRHRSGEWVRVAFPLALVSGFSMVLAEIDIVMVGALLEPMQAGIYVPASRMATLVSFGLFAVNMIAAPMIGEFHAQKRRDDLQRVLTFGARATLAFALPGGAVLVLLGKPFLAIFGPEFTEAYTSLLILTATHVAGSLTGSVAFLMIMTNDQDRAMRFFGVAALVNVVLNAALVPRLGIVGAATATALANTGCRFTMLFYILRHYGLNPTALPARPRLRRGGE